MKKYLDGLITALVSDITKQKADAIVNAANSSLMGGGGVDGAIHRAGGPVILEDCKKIRKEKFKEGLPPGEAVETSAGNLDAKYVIHTVGPVYRHEGDKEDDILADAYYNSLILAENLGCKSIAFPAISTGVYGYPAERAASVVSKVLKAYHSSGGKIKEIYLIFYSKRDLEIFDRNQKFN